MGHLYPCLVRRVGSWRVYALCAVVCLIITGGAHAADVERSKRVLTITTGSRLAPGFMLADRELLQALAKATTARIETYAENLDLIRFPSEQYGQIFSEYLSAKYAVNPPDLVILLFVGNLEVPGKWLPKLFPNTPIIVAGITEEEFRPDQFGPFVRGIAQRLNPHANLELILRLQPEVRRVVVIGGTAEIDRQVLKRARDAAQHFRDKIVIDFWEHLTMEELHRAVTALPRNTAILFAAMFRDGAGGAFVSSQVAHAIGQWANVPMYAMSDADIGSDAVGGSVASIAAYGKRAGELAGLVLTGTEVKSLPFETSSDTVPTFNWPALQRWGIPESRLPPGSVVLNKPTSIWKQYGVYIIAAIIIFLVESAIIADLLIERRRRHRVEAELGENQQLMELATSAGEIGLWARDLKSGTLWTNGPLRSMFAFRENDTVQLSDMIARIHPEDRPRVVAHVQHAQEHDLPFEGEFRIALADGTFRWVLAKGRTAHVSQNGDVRRLGVVLDTTERKRVELELQRQREELAHVARVSTIGELTTAVAHELNQPLGAILSNAEAAEIFLMTDPPDLEEVRQILADIRHDDQRAGEVIRRMRTLLRKQELTPRLIDSNEVVQEALKLLNIDASARKVTLKFERTPDLPLVWCDPVHFQQVVLNLVLNGMEAMAPLPEERRKIVVRTGYGDKGTVKIAVADSGPGIPPDSLPKLFEPFFTTKNEGMGMGLSIARTIVEAHGGQIWAENNAGAGATFYFTVPVAGKGRATSVEGRVKG